MKYSEVKQEKYSYLSFLFAYANAAFTLSKLSDNSEEESKYNIVNLSKKTMIAGIKDCSSFYKQNKTKIEGRESEAGNDFWLTRNGHGAGFWDGDWEHGEELTKSAHSYGEFELYLGDDNKIYHYHTPSIKKEYL